MSINSLKRIDNTGRLFLEKPPALCSQSCDSVGTTHSAKHAIFYVIRKCLTALCYAGDRFIQSHSPAVILERRRSRSEESKREEIVSFHTTRPQILRSLRSLEDDRAKGCFGYSRAGQKHNFLCNKKGIREKELFRIPILTLIYLLTTPIITKKPTAACSA